MKKVLVVDDSATARMFVKRCLQMSGLADAEVFEAGHGIEALEVLRREKDIELMVSDLVMPEMDGTELVKRVAASPRLNGLPTIVVTSITNPVVVAELERCGVAKIIQKPVNPAKMTDALAKINGIVEDDDGGYGEDTGEEEDDGYGY